MSSSWFSATTLSDAWKQVNEQVQQVQSSLPVVDQAELFQKLTLESPELKEERMRLEAEEFRKEKVKEYLSELLPWETRDEKHDILVQECKEAIISLSVKEHTFTMPFSLPDNVTMFLPFEVVHDEDETPTEEEETDPVILKSKAQQKLQKLEPLPPLLQHFDLDAHVGLIERLLKEDENLRDIHACLAGAGEREYAFWHNYFFNCAYIRYTVGLSVDEIWGTKPLPASVEETKQQIMNLQNNPETKVDDDEASQELTFETASVSSTNSNTNFIASSPLKSIDTHIQIESIKTHHDNDVSSDSNIRKDYEVVQSNTPLNEEELDDLEAEILRELED